MEKEIIRKKLKGKDVYSIIKRFHIVLSCVDDDQEIVNHFIKEDPRYARFVENLSQENQIKLIEDSTCNLKYIKNPSEELKLLAVKINPDSIQYIKNPSEQIQIESVKRAGWCIKFIKNPSEIVQMEAVYNSRHVISSIKNATDNVKFLNEVLSNDGFINEFINEKIKYVAEFLLNKAIEESERDE